MQYVINNRPHKTLQTVLVCPPNAPHLCIIKRENNNNQYLNKTISFTKKTFQTMNPFIQVIIAVLISLGIFASSNDWNNLSEQEKQQYEKSIVIEDKVL